MVTHPKRYFMPSSAGGINAARIGKEAVITVKRKTDPIPRCACVLFCMFGGFYFIDYRSV
jgi:hypothetical protein